MLIDCGHGDIPHGKWKVFTMFIFRLWHGANEPGAESSTEKKRRQRK